MLQRIADDDRPASISRMRVRRIRPARVLAALVAVGGGALGLVAQASASSKPVASVASASLTASSTALGRTGGMVVLHAMTPRASTCTVSAAGLRFDERVGCTGGAAWVWVPGNDTSSSERYTFVLVPAGSGGVAATATVTVAPRSSTRPLLAAAVAKWAGVVTG